MTARLSPRRVLVWLCITFALVVVAAACGGDSNEKTPTAGTGAGPTPAQLAEAKRLVNIGDLPATPPAPVVACVARVVVQNPSLDQIANDIAQMPDPDLREAVIYSYLLCGYNYILDSYMRFAPSGTGKSELACIRSTYAQLNEHTLSEVIVLDPDAGYTGPLVIHACTTGSKKNPLLKNGELITMGGS